MEYVILDNVATINGVEYTSVVNIINVDNEQMKANVNISNTEIYLNVPLSLIGLEHSIKNYFAQNIEVETNG